MNITMQFTALRGSATFTEGDRTACEIAFEEKLTVRLWYDFREEALTLAASACESDAILLNIRPYRIELYVNGALCDEEWPCGKGYLTLESKVKGDFAPTLSPLTPEVIAELPYYTRRSIETAAIRAPGVNVGDCIPYSDETDTDGKYHLFYLYDRHHHCSKWGFGAHQWAHVSTTDFKVWDEHPMAVGITEDWEGSICTGSVCRGVDENGEKAWYAWYAVRMCDRSPARMTYAKSKDLVHFEKCGEYFSLPEGYEPTSARDPMVFYMDGKYHMFVTTSRLSDKSGCLAHLVNDRMAIDGWQDAGATMAWIEHCDENDPTRYWQPECPDHFKIGEWYYLVFGIGGRGHYCFSKDPYGDWIFPENDTIPCGNVPKSATLPGSGRRVFMGFINEGGRDFGYAGRLCGVEAFQNPDGTLRFEPLAL